jgi:hypothetical protein
MILALNDYRYCLLVEIGRRAGRAWSLSEPECLNRREAVP